MLRRTLAVIGVLFLTMPVFAGTWTSNNFLYKPGTGARGESDKKIFDSGLDRVDTRLGKEIWVGDPNYGPTLPDAVSAIGGNRAILRIPRGAWSIGADLSIPAGVTLKPELGAILNIATGVTLTINGGLEAGLYQVFSCTGTGQVAFGAGAVQAVYPEWWGVTGSGDETAINAAMNSLPSAGGVVNLSKAYITANTILFPKNGVKLHGTSRVPAKITYTGTGTAVGSLNKETVYLDECGFDNIQIFSTTAALGFDFTGFRYGQFRDFKIVVKADNAIALYGKKMTGLDSNPSYNNFDGIYLAGNTPVNTGSVGIKLDCDPAANNPFNGPSANNFSNIHRINSFTVAIDLVAGNGNNFTNIQFESIVSGAIRLGYVSSPDDTGTFTSGSNSQFTDNSKSWTPGKYNNASIEITGGTGSGQSCRIINNTVTQINIDGSFCTYLDNTSQYALYANRAFGNTFTNIRLEGNNSCIPIYFGKASSHNIVANTPTIFGVSSTYMQRDIENPTNNWVPSGDGLIDLVFTAENLPADSTVIMFPTKYSDHRYNMPFHGYVVSVTLGFTYRGSAPTGSLTGALSIAGNDVSDLNTSLPNPAAIYPVQRVNKVYDTAFAHGYFRRLDPICYKLTTSADWQAGVNVTVHVLVRPLG
jgi:hypothetical protein